MTPSFLVTWYGKLLNDEEFAVAAGLAVDLGADGNAAAPGGVGAGDAGPSLDDPAGGEVRPRDELDQLRQVDLGPSR